jgi:hypothetical protein
MTAFSQRRFTCRPLAPRARGGASSMLRLSQAQRLPAAPALEAWMERAARALAQPVDLGQ